MDCINIPTLSLKKLARGNVRAKVTMLHNSITRLTSSSRLINNNGAILGTKSKLKSTSDLNGKFIHTLNLIGLKSENNADISATLLLSGVFHSRLKSNSQLSIPYIDKLGGSFDVEKYKNFNCVEKLYPTQDVVSSSGNNYFVNQDLQTSGLYNSIDEGIFTTQYDDKDTYIQPWSTYSSGNFKYTFNIDNPLVRPKESLLFIRASAPLKNNSSFTVPVYKINNIRFEDPSGNLIIKYKDFVIRGDANYDNEYVNFTTYITEPDINNASLDTWDSNYPVLGSGTFSGNYKVNIDLTIESLDDPFNDGYDVGYEDRNTFTIIEHSGNNYLALDGAPLSTQTQDFINPEYTLRITAIELCNSGELSSFRNNYVPFYTDVLSTGLRITRNIFPSQVLNFSYNNDIYPSSNNSSWTSFTSNNLTTQNSSKLVPLLSDENNSTYISLNYSSISDSGKLQLKFEHKPPVAKDALYNGAFNFGQYRPILPFDSAEISNVVDADNFFTIDDIELKVIARKANGSRNYSLDIVGYSDDKLLHVTSQIGGFLQNIENSGGYIPSSSGFKNINDLGVSTEPISNKNQYFESNLTNNNGGDHYLLSTNPVISGTSFDEYTIPLKIYEDRVNLGQSIDYSMSSYFENLYLDIYPIPSGASISKIWLVIKYKPSNGLMLHTIGQADKEFAKRQVKILPSYDFISESGSLINDIPHAYTRNNTLKINYANRWKATDGSLFVGPYNDIEFDFSFYKPQMYTPYLNGYFSFIHDSGNSIISDYFFNKERLNIALSGTYIGNYNKINNIGLRFNYNSLFNEQTSNTTIDWTRIAGYENNLLYGKITDNFENAIRVSGNLGYINFGPVVTSGAFFISTRFSPDINMSGIGYNLWNSGVLFSKYSEDLELAVCYSGGKLTGHCQDINSNIITVQDNKFYYEYTYPLTISISYNENDNKLKLITENSVKDTSDNFILKGTSGNLTFGYSEGYDVGINGFITNIGISTLNTPSGINNSGINILTSGIPTISSKESLYKNFYRDLYQSINKDTNNWHLGAFKICQFNQDYDRFTFRYGSGLLTHYLKHNGSDYINNTNLTLPSSIYLDNISYHTQIENDFIRFGLQDTNESNPNIYSTYPRINKNLPRGYKFEEEAFVVETILEHDIDQYLVWDNGLIGPKLLVSLYTPNKEPISYPTTNYGLINRRIHYLEPSGCWRKISTKFDFNDLINDSEPWSSFNKDQYITEFNHKYFSKDIDDMFLQYDLIFPSGKSFESLIKIHSVTVRLNNSLVTSSGTNDFINLNVSGQAVVRENINLSIPNIFIPSSSYIDLYCNANISGVSSEIINLSCSGAVLSSGYMPLHSITIGSLSNAEQNFGSFDLFGSSPNFGLNLYTSGQLFREEDVNLFTQNNILDQSSSGIIPLISFNLLSQYNIDDNIRLRIRGKNIPINTIPTSSMNLYTVSPKSVTIDNSTNLVVASFDPNILDINMSLFIVNRPLISVELGSDIISWNNKNTGLEITVSDNIYSSLSANDEIRGVELICYGDCK